MADAILVERNGAIATVTLNRPEKLNALTRAMWGALGDAVQALAQDASVRCIVLRGAGEKAFSPGNDIAEFATERSNKQQAIEYGIEASEIERYVVNPGQACAYMIGQLKLVELREKMRSALGSRFDEKAYHDLVLSTGTVPLTLLEQVVDRSIAANRAASQ